MATVKRMTMTRAAEEEALVGEAVGEAAAAAKTEGLR